MRSIYGKTTTNDVTTNAVAPRRGVLVGQERRGNIRIRSDDETCRKELVDVPKVQEDGA